ncbi:hypothetical protein E0W80_15725 [Microbacterium sp. PI-1]|uniref:ATPase, T2SS/T4P/T4SS family n=1 Tax=Microbacterium sp. PI-1 TaxID=2545631 RepID=UPI00103AAEAA|nr:ATPase, T2SS/T4P/T4SS family [Microbacterium sp. PI-1]TCJ21788.1 hypothetical protein E0W80_15725 [Microbacterium sp. PI-1]
MTDQPDIEIATRPFLGDMLSPSSSATPPVQPAPTSGNHHLLAAMTGGRPPLHLVDDTDSEQLEQVYANSVDLAAAYPTETEPDEEKLRARSRRRETAAIRADGYLQVDWNIVKQLTRELTAADESIGRSRRSFDVATASPDPEDEFEQRTIDEIKVIINRYTTRIAGAKGSDHDWTDLKKAHYTQAIFDQAHRYGRLQQYLREPDVEDVSVVGYANVVVTKTNGIRERRSPIAEDDKDLEDLIAEIASHRGRTFTKPNGYLDLDIGGARLSATGVGITSDTNLTIRKHNLVDIELADMVANGTISQKIADFMAAASRANLCVIVAGFPGAGKTTMLRALMSTIRPEEKIVTIETERELYLNKLPDRHWQVQDLQYIPPQSAGADSAAGFTLDQCFMLAVRSSAQRILFAEIRGPEGPVAFKAMEAGRGSMSTIHARSADHTIRRLAIVLMSEEGLTDDTVPMNRIGDSLDLILYISELENPDGTRRRVVTEVAEVRPNDQGLPMASKLFKYDPNIKDWTNPEDPSPQLDGPLRRAGYDWEKEIRG